MSVIENWETKDDEIEPCTPEERWSTPTKYAVMKEGRKTAVKVCATEEEAQSFIDDLEKDKDKHTIEVRPGIDKKCEDYCPCYKFCSYYKETHKSEVTE